jgi:Pyrimidine dimer DNA glycosylase
LQTFLPDKSFIKSLEYLDVKRLGKQRVEAAQIIEILLNQPILPSNLKLPHFDRSQSLWHRHPAVMMWAGHEEWLKLYLDCCIGEWVWRGYTNGLVVPAYNTDSQSPPKWLGFEQFHQSHRSNLIRKFPQHYQKFWPNESSDLAYFWPTKEGFEVND